MTPERAKARLSALCQCYADREALRVLVESEKWKTYTIVGGGGGGQTLKSELKGDFKFLTDDIYYNPTAFQRFTDFLTGRRSS